MSLRSRYYNPTSFLDVLFNTLLGFVILFIVAFMLIILEKKDAAIDTKAEFVITLTWEDESKDDVDTWLEDPTGSLLSFKDKEVGLMHLDRDDLGEKKDVIKLPDGTEVEYKHNQEITTIRGFISGEWVLNIHMYSKRDDKPVKVEVKIDKLNPSVTTIVYKKFTMAEHWEEITVVRFTMTARGEILSTDDLFKQLTTVSNRGGSVDASESESESEFGELGF